MVLHSPYYIGELVGIVIAIVVGLYVYLKYIVYNYWSSRNITFIKPVLPYGSFAPIIKGEVSIGVFFRDMYLKYKKSPVFGYYTFHKPSLVVSDPQLIRLVLTKEFSNFHDRGVYCNEEVDPLLNHMFVLPGVKWRYMRTKFSPTFTSSKIKQMFFTMKDCSETLTNFVADTAKESGQIEIKDLVARFSTDVIASAAFGLECNSIENPDAEFRELGRKFFKISPVVQGLAQLFPPLLKLLKLPVVHKDVSDYFIGTFKKNIEHRRANNVVRNDFMNLTMQLMDYGYLQGDEGAKPQKELEGDDTKKITMLEAAAQAFLFYAAGFETSSTTATFCLYELALHQDIQDKVADEINRILEEFNGLTYEGVKKMHYLDKVVSETLRKYPPVPILNRQCTQDFDLPGAGLRVTKGIDIVIPVLGIHSDPEIYPDPSKFDPERFTEENITGRHPYTYLPFGEGPRNCIGMRFGLVQTKVALVSMLSTYRVTPSPNLKIPLALEKHNFLLSPDSDIMLKIEQR